MTAWIRMLNSGVGRPWPADRSVPKSSRTTGIARITIMIRPSMNLAAKRIQKPA
jgi:hypothetical protein